MFSCQFPFNLRPLGPKAQACYAYLLMPMLLPETDTTPEALPVPTPIKVLLTDAIRLAELLWLLPTAAEAWLEAPVSALMLSELLAELALEPVLAVVRAETEQLNCRSM